MLYWKIGFPMDHALSTHLFVNHRLTTSTLDRIWTAGIPAVEIFCARQHLDYHNKAQVAELGHWFRDSNMRLHSMHAPMYNDDVWGRSGPNSIIDITEPVKAKRVGMVDEIKRVLEIAEIIPYKYLVQHIGTGWADYDERRMESAFSSLDELTVFARQRGVEVLLENIPNGFSGAANLNTFLELTHLRVGFCFDIGHAHLTGNIESEFDMMRDRIRSTHIHDNDGKDDKHIFPFVGDGGTIDWKRGMRLLASRPQQYPLLLELKEAPEFPHPLDAVKQIFERMEALATLEPEER
jgi:sugar phosphate isomerase/epimerase